MQEPYEIHWKDYYKILQININATEEEIKKNYRLLSKKYHPDYNEGMEERFKELNEAYSILSDIAKRQRYNNYYIYKTQNKQYQTQNNYNNYNKTYDFYQNIEKIIVIQMAIENLREELIKNKIKELISKGIFIGSAAWLGFDVPKYIEITKMFINNEKPRIFLPLLVLIIKTSIIRGSYKTLNIARQHETEYLREINELEKEIRRTLKI